jgi:hypothetical protein
MALQRTIHTTPDPLPWRPRMAAGALALAALLLTTISIADKAVLKSDEDSLVMRCERMSGVVGRNLVSQGMTSDSASWRRQKQLAFRACIDDYAAFERLISTQ